MIGRQLTLLATAATFLTRWPWVARFAVGDDLSISQAARYYPLIGALVGASGAALLWLAQPLFGLAAVVAALALTSASTGAFHEDGLADSYDGLYGGYERSRKLEIMRDSRIGTFGALALIYAVALKIVLLAELPSATAAWGLIAAMTLGRLAPLAVLRALTYAREDGPYKPIAVGVTAVDGSIALALTIAILAALVAFDALPLGAVLAMTAAAGLLMLLGIRWLRAHLGGYTGDGLGAVNQHVEIAALAALVLQTRLAG